MRKFMKKSSLPVVIIEGKRLTDEDVLVGDHYAKYSQLLVEVLPPPPEPEPVVVEAPAVVEVPVVAEAEVVVEETPKKKRKAKVVEVESAEEVKSDSKE